MSSGWKLVATLGAQGTGYPHILVDKHGWCLRLGPSARQDEKYYSSFSNLLGGLMEHVPRRRLKSTHVLQGLEDLARGVNDAVRMARELSCTAQETVIHEHIRRCGLLAGVGRRPVPESAPARAESPDKSPCCEVATAS